MQLSTKILVGMSAGIIVGLLFNALGGSDPDESVLITWVVENIFDVIGKIFVVSLKLLVVPLVFFSLVCGSASMGEDILRPVNRITMGSVPGSVKLTLMGM